MCSICQEPLSAEYRLKGCGHSFHDICVYTWLSINASCPICRQVDVEFLERRLYCHAIAIGMTMVKFANKSDEKYYFSFSKIRRNNRIFFNDEFNDAIKRNDVIYFWSKYTRDLDTLKAEPSNCSCDKWDKFYNTCLDKIIEGSRKGCW